MRIRRGGAMITHRGFFRLSFGISVAAGLAGHTRYAFAGQPTTVALVKSPNRAQGLGVAIDLLDLNSIRGKRIVLKPNFNSRDAFPGSTHNDTLLALIDKLSGMGASSCTVADRSGMGNTRDVMEHKGILDLAQEIGFDPIVIDEIPADQWIPIAVEDGHWKRQLFFPKLFLEADGIVQTCCLKTHQFGGHFTLSLKNSVGMIAKRSPVDGYDFMQELHSSAHQRRMIAEVNSLYAPDLILLDAMEGFVTGGPAIGKKVAPGVMIAGTDRVAVDAVGVAILRRYGTTADVRRGEIFEQEQIARAAELGIGIDSPIRISFAVPDEASAAFVDEITPFLTPDDAALGVGPGGSMRSMKSTWARIKSE